jgi:hypothetical protein
VSGEYRDGDVHRHEHFNRDADGNIDGHAERDADGCTNSD